jgi:ferredoxin
VFRRASFCKYVCPVGQFNFLGSTLAPLEVAVRDTATCDQCRTHDCIRGAPAEPDPAEPRRRQIAQRGCELALFQPRKVGNLDCTFCLDCVYACPHDNVGIFARLPGEELAMEGKRSGIGSIERRFDFTALAVVFTFGALLNAFAMISPVYAVEQSVAAVTGLRVEWPILAAMFTLVLVVEPALLLGAAAVVTRRLAETGEPVLAIVKRFSRSLVPIGFGVWLAHYGFHFFTGALTVIPVTQNAVLRSLGWPLLGDPRWQLAGFPESVVFPMEIGFMSLGLAGSWAVGWALARGLSPDRPWRSFSPWGALHLLLFVSAVWIISQPMEMRGTFLGG